MSPERHEGEPPDTRLGHTANEMLKLIEDTDMRVVVFLEDDGHCMTGLGGWESDTEAIAAVFAHLVAVFEANGKKLMLVPLGKG